MRIVISSLFLLITAFGFSQNKNILSNEQYLLLQDKTRAYFNSNIDSSFFYVNKIEESGNIVHKAFAAGVKGYLYAKEGDFTKADKYYSNALQLIKSAPKSYLRTQNEAYIYNYGGMIDWANGKFTEALDNYFIAKKLAESIDDLVQVVKTNNNIALIDSNAGNYNKAIAIARETNRIVDDNRHLYTDSQYTVNKSSINFNLGVYYENQFFKDHAQRKALDSAFYFFDKALTYSDNRIENKVKAQKHLGNICFLKNDFATAEKIYYSVAVASKENSLDVEYYSANFNLGYIYYKQKMFNKSLIYFQKVKLVSDTNNTNFLDYMYSNYFQAKLFELLNDDENALKHSRVYLDYFEKNKSKINEDMLEINYKIGNQDSVKEMNDLQKEYKDRLLFKNIGIGFFSLLFTVLLILVIINYKKRKAAEQKITAVLEEFKFKSGNQDIINSNDVNDVQEESDRAIKEPSSISLDNEKEIMLKLKALESKMFYLKPEFTQQEVAKKIKTNTTYLSYVVNKNYNKSFSAYYNELRINYAINEIISNTKYRAYTTQAIAESVGFKNADSFASSFKKKTGVTPYQFINEIKKRELV
jgi:AraC-like DNA-binding protein